MKLDCILQIAVFLFILPFLGACNKEKASEQELRGEFLTSIYSKEGRYVAFCDLIHFGGRFYCVFREGENHARYHEWHTNGEILVLSSNDFVSWEKEFQISDDVDLRDPCFCIKKETGEVFLYYVREQYENPEINKTGFSIFKRDEGKLKVVSSGVADAGEYSSYTLWKVEYYNNAYYSIAYFPDKKPVLLKSLDGCDFKYVSELPIDGNEASLSFDSNGNVICFLRNNTPKGPCFVLETRPPYTDWSYYQTNEMIESPESFYYKGELYVAGRSYYGMSLFKYEKESRSLTPIYNYFAYGDWGNSGYPGIVVKDDYMYTVYYAVNPDGNNVGESCNTEIYTSNIYLPSIVK